MKELIKFAVVGYGARGNGRGHSLLKLAVDGIEGIQAAAICETAPDSLEKAKEEFPDTELFNDFDEMLEKASIDALLIETPADNHAKFAIKALDKNIHVISDIPTVWTKDEAWDLWDAHERSKAIYMTGSNPNFSAFIETALDLKKKDLLGDPYYVECAYIHDVRGLWEKTPWRKNLPCIKYCTHSLGPVLRIIEEEFKWVSCFDTGSHINKQEGQHDAMAALLRTPSNIVVRLLTSFINHYCGGGHHYRFFTTKGCFERTPPYHTLYNRPEYPHRTLFYSKELHTYNNWIELPTDVMPVEYARNPKAKGHGGLDYAMLDHFFRAIREGLPSPISLREGLMMTLPGTFAAESAEKGGQLVEIEYPWD